MTKQLLFYERAVPVTAQRHGDWSLEARKDYKFAAHTNAVPLTAVKIPAATGEHTIVFAGKEEALRPIAVLGLTTDENRYLDGEGRWKARYLPAETLAGLAKTNVLELIYVHLQSMRNISAMLPRAAQETEDIDAAMAEAGLTAEKQLH